MINHRKQLLRLTVIALAVVGGPVKVARAQQAAAGAGKPASAVPAPTGDIPPDVLPDVPQGEAGAPQQTGDQPETSNLAPSTGPGPGQPQQGATSPEAASNRPPLVFPSVAPGTINKRRVKPLQTSVGMDPTAPDFGAEADLVSTANEGAVNIKPKRWTFVMHGFLRAPFRLGIGPTNPALDQNGMHSDSQWHSPPHLVGAFNNDWNSVGLNPAPTAGLYLSVGNAVVSGTLIISADTFFDAGYRNLSAMGGVSQGYVTMKFSDLFGNRGGLAVNAGAFVNRYGLAGPEQQSSGYYNTFLFGRTRVAGEAVTADIDLTDHLELVLEQGLGSKMEVVPWLATSLSGAPYLPDQGPTPQGSTFVQQEHVALLVDDWFRVAGHFMTEWSPNDLSASVGGVQNPKSSQLTVMGGEVHLDHARYGNAYVGYSHMDAVRVLSLADGIQAIHADNGYGLVKNYLNPAYVYVPGVTMTPAPAPGSAGDSGKIDTVMFQYILRLSPLLDLPSNGRDLGLAVYGMFNHVTSASLAGGSQDKFKAGAELQFSALRFLSIGARVDRAMPNGGNSDVAYTAVSPRLVIHSSWLSREYLLLSYTRYFFGSSPQFMPTMYEGAVQPDKNLIVLSAVISF
jgi:hypothetical protein